MVESESTPWNKLMPVVHQSSFLLQRGARRSSILVHFKVTQQIWAQTQSAFQLLSFQCWPFGLDCLRLLIDDGAEVNYGNRRGHTPFGHTGSLWTE